MRLSALLCLLTIPGFAQTDPWSAVRRGSWVQTGAQAAGDVQISSRTATAPIVIAANENSAVRQAAEFLAADIEKISGRRPQIVPAAPTSGPTIHLVTLSAAQLPVDIRAIQGQWESYRIVTEGSNVWLIGANPRGTAFAAYALSERLGIDPLYIWTGYKPEHRDPLILKRTNFTQSAPTFKYRGFFHDVEDLLPRPFDANGYPLQTGDVPLDWYKRFFETALRLQMNMVAPYVRVH